MKERSQGTTGVRRKTTRLWMIVLAIAACSQPASAPNTSAEPTTTLSTTTSTTTTTFPPTTTTTLSEEELAQIEYEADTSLVRALWRGHSDSWFDGLEAGVAYQVAHNHPDLTCTADQFLANLRETGAEDGYQEEVVLNADTIERDDGWTLSDTGEVPEGRIYIHQMTITFSQPGFESASELIEAHSAILDGQAYYFIGLQEGC